MTTITRPANWWTTPSRGLSRSIGLTIAIASVVAVVGMWGLAFASGELGAHPLIVLLELMISVAWLGGALALSMALTRSPERPAFLLTAIAIALGIAAAVMLLLSNTLDRMVAQQAQTDAMVRQASIEAFVNNGDKPLSSEARASMIAKMSAMPDEQLCKVEVLPPRLCHER